MTPFDDPRAHERRLETFGPAVVAPAAGGPDPSRPVPDISANGRGRPGPLHVDAEHPVDVLAVLDTRGRITFLSPSAERVLGLDVGQAVGTQALKLFDQESAAHARRLFADLVMGRRLCVRLDVRAEGPDGRPVDLELVAAGRLQPHGGVVVTMRDPNRDSVPAPVPAPVPGPGPALEEERDWPAGPPRAPRRLWGSPPERPPRARQEVGTQPAPSAPPAPSASPAQPAPPAPSEPPAPSTSPAPSAPPAPSPPRSSASPALPPVGSASAEAATEPRPARATPPARAPGVRAAAEGDRWQSSIIESLTEGVMIVDRTGTVLRVNEAFEVMFEAPRVRVVGRRLADLLSAGRELGVEVEEDGAVAGRGNPVMRAIETGRRSVGAVFRVQRPGRPRTWVRASAQPLFDDDGRVAGAVASFDDITAVRQAARRLRREERFSQVLLDTLDEGIIACDAEGRLTVFNPAARRLHGLDDEDDPIGSLPLDGWFRRPDGGELGPGEHPLLRALSGERLRDLELLLEAEDGTTCKVLVNGESLVDDAGRRLGAVIAVHDVTEQKRNEERLAELALHDPLTALANRTLLAERLQEAIDRLALRTLEAGPGGPADGTTPGVAVYLLDLDDFKEVNDQLGHDVGDEVLVAVGRRLAAIVRPSDTVARLGGDEFVVLCEVEGGEEEMERIGARISEALTRPYRIEGRTLSVGASVGGVFVDNPDTDPSRLLSRADDAMYGVKWSRRRQRRSMAD